MSCFGMRMHNIRPFAVALVATGMMLWSIESSVREVRQRAETLVEQQIPELRAIAGIVAQANAAGRAASRPGIAAGAVDQAARAVIEAAGYGPQFFHRTGHGLGLEEHEPPYMFGENGLILAPGMTYTVEPGIYLAERGGVRIEDNVAITEAGCETLSDMPRDLVTL